MNSNKMKNGRVFKKDRIGRLVFASNTFEGYLSSTAQRFNNNFKNIIFVYYNIYKTLNKTRNCCI